MKRITCSAFFTAFAACALAAPTITVVSASQTGTNVVKVVYSLSEPAIVTFDVYTNGASIALGKAWSVEGDINRKLAAGEHAFDWFQQSDWPADLPAEGCRIALVPWTLDNPPDYMVVKLGVYSNVTFHATAENVPFGVVSQASRRYQMVFRRIHAANVVWRMGTDGNTSSEIPRNVTLTNDYYMGVFPVTYEQHNMFVDPYANSGLKGLRPDNALSYEALRGTAATGHDWPTDGHAVAEDSAIGVFRAQSGLTRVDLPTEAEWEYACRAGNSGKWCFGDNGNLLPKYAWYSYRYPNNERPLVGLLEPNAFGLYDMHGTGWEWCLDWYSTGADYAVSGESVTAPGGPASGTVRALRGGSYAHDYNCARSAYRDRYDPTQAYTTIIYRLACPVDLRMAEDGEGTGGTPVVTLAEVTDFAPAIRTTSSAGGFGTSAAPLDFKARLDVFIDGLNFDSRKPFGFHLILR